MTIVDKKIYSSFLYLLKNGKKINVSSVSRYAKVDRNSLYFRLNKLVS